MMKRALAITLTTKQLDLTHFSFVRRMSSGSEQLKTELEFQPALAHEGMWDRLTHHHHQAGTSAKDKTEHQKLEEVCTHNFLLLEALVVSSHTAQHVYATI